MKFFFFNVEVGFLCFGIYFTISTTRDELSVLETVIAALGFVFMANFFWINPGIFFALPFVACGKSPCCEESIEDSSQHSSASIDDTESQVGQERIMLD